jgi:hypothetical protein
MKIDSKKVGLFLKSINEAEYIFMQHCMQMRDNINTLIKRHNLSKEEFCQRFRIKPAKYNDYIKGNYNYSIMDIACLNAAFIELESKKLEENLPIKISETIVVK